MNETMMTAVEHSTNPLLELFFDMAMPMAEARLGWVMVIAHMIAASFVSKGVRLRSYYIFAALFFSVGVLMYTESTTEINHTNLAHFEVALFGLFVVVYPVFAGMHLFGIHHANVSNMIAMNKLASYRSSISGIFEEAFKNGPQPLIIVDYDGEILAANDLMATTLGYQAFNLEGKHVDILLPEEYRNGHVAKIREFLHSETSKASRPVKVLRRNGKKSDMKLSISSIRVGSELYGMGALT